MKKTTKILAILLCFVMGATLFTACGGGGSNNDGSASPSTSASENPASPSASSSASASPAPSVSSAAPSASALPPPDPSLAAPAPTVEGVKLADHIELIIDTTQIGVLNPLAAAGTGNATNWCYGMYLDRLIQYQVSDGSLQPALATSWETDDYQTYIFHLRDDVYWHDGEKFTANDVVFTWSRGITDAAGAPCYDYWMRIENCEALDDYTVKFTLYTVHVDFLFGMSLMYVSILSEKAVTADPEKGPMVGTGAYKVIDFSSRDYVAYERNENYWGTIPVTKTQTWRNTPEMSARTIAMLNGEVQVCFDVSETDLGLFMDDPDWTVTLYGGQNPNGLHFNQDDPLMADYNFRMAVLYGLDRDEITLFANGALAQYMTDGAMWSLGVPHRNTDLPYIRQDIDKAKEYLAASSYAGQPVELTTAMVNNITIAEVIQEQLGRVGIDIVINQLDSPSFTAATTWAENKTQMTIWSNLLGMSPFGYLNNFRPGVVHNRAKFVNEEITDILNSLPSVIDEDEADAMWKRAQEIIFENACDIPLSYRAGAVITAKGIGGIVLQPNMLNDMRNMYWEIG